MNNDIPNVSVVWGLWMIFIVAEIVGEKTDTEADQAKNCSYTKIL